jgi:hypothetical protein
MRCAVPRTLSSRDKNKRPFARRSSFPSACVSWGTRARRCLAVVRSGVSPPFVGPSPGTGVRGGIVAQAGGAACDWPEYEGHRLQPQSGHGRDGAATAPVGEDARLCSPASGRTAVLQRPRSRASHRFPPPHRHGNAHCTLARDERIGRGGVPYSLSRPLWATLPGPPASASAPLPTSAAGLASSVALGRRRRLGRARAGRCTTSCGDRQVWHPLLGVAACSHPAFQASPRRVSQITFVQFAPVEIKGAMRDEPRTRRLWPREERLGDGRDMLGARSCVHATLAPSTSSVRWISRPREQMRCTTIHLPAGPPPASIPFPSTLGRPRSRAHRRDRASRGIACSSFPADHRNGLRGSALGPSMFA